MLHNKCEGHGKYLGLPGHEPRLYNTSALLEDSDILVVTEGEIDAMTVHLCGIPAVGFQGVDAWEKIEDEDGYEMKIFSRAIGHYETILVPADGDDVGFAAAKDIARQLMGRVLAWPEKEDANSIYQREGKTGVRKVLLGE